MFAECLQHGRLQKKRKENVPTAMRKMHRCVSIFVLSFEENETKKKTVGFDDVLVFGHASVFFLVIHY